MYLKKNKNVKCTVNGTSRTSTMVCQSLVKVSICHEVLFSGIDLGCMSCSCGNCIGHVSSHWAAVGCLSNILCSKQQMIFLHIISLGFSLPSFVQTLVAVVFASPIYRTENIHRTKLD